MLLIIFTIIIIFIVHQFYWRRRSLPPGPMPLPLIGNMLSLSTKDQQKMLQKWRDQYGDLYTIWMGNTPVVTLNDFPTIQKTFIKDGSTYEDRPRIALQEVFKGGAYGVIFTTGPLWKEHRRFGLKVLRDFGLGKNLMQERILTEFTAMLDDIKDDLKANKQPSIQDEIDRAIGSIINVLTIGYRFDRSKIKEFEMIKEVATTFMVRFSSLLDKTLESEFDILKHIPPFKQEHLAIQSEGESFEKFFMKKINEHRDKINLESDEDSLDFCEAFLKKQHELEKQGITDHNYTDKQLYAMIFDLWIAGQETTSSTLAWLCIYLLNYPEVQDKLINELKTVIGSDRIITLDDKINLPYTNAVITEAQRHCNLITQNLLHQTTKDVEIHGYHIPKGTIINAQVSNVMTDPRYFKNPEKFYPERFIDKDGKYFCPQEFVPFSIGKRACLGEGLAKMELFLFAANIFNNFKLLPENGILPELGLNEIGSSVPRKFKCKLQAL